MFLQEESTRLFCERIQKFSAAYSALMMSLHCHTKDRNFKVVIEGNIFLLWLEAQAVEFQRANIHWFANFRSVKIRFGALDWNSTHVISSAGGKARLSHDTVSTPLGANNSKNSHRSCAKSSLSKARWCSVPRMKLRARPVTKKAAAEAVGSHSPIC